MKRNDHSNASGKSDSGGARHVPRLYLDAPLAEGQAVELDRDRTHRLVNVMRRTVGDRVLAFNGREGEWDCELALVRKKAAVLRVLTRLREQPQAAPITLAFAPLKHARLDYLAQKAAEMGVARVVPVLTAHTVAGRFNQDRFRANLIEGAEQCGVLWIADVAAPVPLERFVAQSEPDQPIVFCDEAAPPASPVEALRAVTAPLSVLIGPEGGFSAAERERIRAHRAALPISLGPRIMRADTAAVAALALVQAVCGDWS